MASTAARAEETAVEAESEHVSLDAQGDTVLVVGNYRIKVFSTMLALVSPVFRAMLGPHFREGSQSRNAANPLEVHLPEDEPDATLIMCHLIYHKKGKEVFSDCTLLPEKLYRLLKVIDKYQCLESLWLSVRALVSAELARDATFWETSILHVAIAYLVDDAWNFKLATKYLVTQFEGTAMFSEVQKYEGGDIIPLNALLAMSEIRQSARHELSKGLSRFADYKRRRMSDFGTDALEKWSGLGGESLNFTMSVLETYETIPAISNVAIKVDELCGGLCLKCVKQGLVDISSGMCKNGHEEG
ncbi:hypothetical protein BDY17DRAFT_306929 [Neohortaea acidophila]|uniref:BTB domain-containing protein n=1 Tax=Neohortaea acidophila TaxID=245834 RepID=A0A6A6Q540_9PEZI|nr:uncharacterized protein BDY17DRAFT_306929 [Neohortaea acidophila]KAF2487558.1 hypothetical protein BDY17DRAFT_306929 [Neohortaea acidophila]